MTHIPPTTPPIKGRTCGPTPLCPARLTALGLLVLAAACGGAPNPRTTTAAPTAARLSPETMSSPQAAYCARKGGTVRAEALSNGTVRAMCHLPDHRIAEIGALYRVEVVDGL